MNSKERFLDKEFWMLSWNASVQTRNGLPVYADNPSDEEKAQLKQFVRNYINKELLPMYECQKVTEEQHCRHIEKLAGEVTTCHDSILHGGEYRIGIAQKLLNLQLKYLWCQDKLDTPPHCPIDGNVLRAVGSTESWTYWTSIKQYDGAIEEIRKHSASEGWQHIADWKLSLFNNLEEFEPIA